MRRWRGADTIVNLVSNFLKVRPARVEICTLRNETILHIFAMYVLFLFCSLTVSIKPKQRVKFIEFAQQFNPSSTYELVALAPDNFLRF